MRHHAHPSLSQYGAVQSQSSATLITQVGLHARPSSSPPQESCSVRITRVSMQLFLALSLSLAFGLLCDWVMKANNLDHKLVGTKHSNVDVSDLTFGLSAIIIFKALAWLFLKTGWFTSLHDHYIQPIASQYTTARQHQAAHPIHLPASDLEETGADTTTQTPTANAAFRGL